MRHATSDRQRRSRGFTLIELMIVVAIAVILGAVAFPSLMDSLRKSRRAEAFTAISAVQQAQERHRSNNATYSDSLGTLGITSSTTSPAGYYTLSVSTETATAGTTYVATALAVSDKSQAKDGACARLGVRVSGGQIGYASCASCSTFATSDFAESNACWKR